MVRLAAFMFADTSQLLLIRGVCSTIPKSLYWFEYYSKCFSNVILDNYMRIRDDKQYYRIYCTAAQNLSQTLNHDIGPILDETIDTSKKD